MSSTKSRRLSSLASNDVSNLPLATGRSGRPLKKVADTPKQPVTISVPSKLPGKRRRSSVRSVRKRRLSSMDSGALAGQGDVKTEGRTQTELELTPAELKANAKFYIDSGKDQLVKVNLETDAPISVESAAGKDSVVIDSIKQLRGIGLKEQPGLLEKFVINDKKMSLKDLCKPLIPIGRVSHDFDRAVEGDKLRAKQQKERSDKRKLSRRLRVPVEQLEGQEEELIKQERERKVKEMLNKDTKDGGAERLNVPQLVTNEDGTLTYSHESTYVDRHTEANAGTKEKVVENPYENLVTSGTYSKQRYVDRWTAQETRDFLKALSMWGTDFGLIAQLFPYRDRKQIKAKFNLEERTHPHLIEFALMRKLPVDLTEYCGLSGKKFKTLDEYNQELEQLKFEHDRQLKTMAAAKEQARVEDLANAQGKIEVPTKVNTKSRRAVLKEFRKNEEVVGEIGQ